jgi:3-hydroxyisobutyrate dehydrogenase-like beta-hydroxyacid dehydrogenase
MTGIAFLGLGAMGSRMAARLIDAGHDLTLWNRSHLAAEALAAKGARIAPTPAEAVANAAIVFAMVTDDDASRSVWLDPARGAALALRSGAIAIECSTLSPIFVRELGERLGAKGVALIDAPVAGSRPQAEAGQLIFMVGGADDALQKARPALEPLASAIHHVGPSGAGAVLKLAVNTLFAAQLASVAELLGFLQRNGFAVNRAAELLALFPVTSAPIAGAARMMAVGSIAPLFTIDLVTKDLAYALAAARASGAELPGAERTHAVFARARAAGFGASNVSGLAAIFAAST